MTCHITNAYLETLIACTPPDLRKATEGWSSVLLNESLSSEPSDDTSLLRSFSAISALWRYRIRRTLPQLSYGFSVSKEGLEFMVSACRKCVEDRMVLDAELDMSSSYETFELHDQVDGYMSHASRIRAAELRPVSDVIHLAEEVITLMDARPCKTARMVAARSLGLQLGSKLGLHMCYTRGQYALKVAGNLLGTHATDHHPARWFPCTYETGVFLYE